MQGLKSCRFRLLSHETSLNIPNYRAVGAFQEVGEIGEHGEIVTDRQPDRRICLGYVGGATHRRR